MTRLGETLYARLMLALLLASCGGSGSGSVGVTVDVDAAGIPKQKVTCVPATVFCSDSTHLATCTLSGADAVVTADCAAAGTTNNPGTCETQGCANGQLAFCLRARPVSAWNLSSPLLQGQSFTTGYDASGVNINIGQVCGADGLVLGSVGLSKATAACPLDADDEPAVRAPRT